MREGARNLTTKHRDKQACTCEGSHKTHFGYERSQRREYIFIEHLCTDVVPSVDAQIPSARRICPSTHQLIILFMEVDSPEGTRSFDDDLLFAVREPRNERADDVLALQQPARRWVVLDQVRHRDARPLAFRGVGTLHLFAPYNIQLPMTQLTASWRTFCMIGRTASLLLASAAADADASPCGRCESGTRTGLCLRDCRFFCDFDLPIVQRSGFR